jgi:hypothetical protein
MKPIRNLALLALTLCLMTPAEAENQKNSPE